MQFLDIKERWPDENKQRINLSSYAVETILQDEEALFPHYIKERKNNGGKKNGADAEYISSTIINHIVGAFFDTAEATIPLRLQQREEELDRQLSETLEASVRERTVKKLLETYRDELKEKSAAYMKLDGSSFMVRLNTGNIERLTDSSLYEEGRTISSFYDDKVGKYLKTLLEEYARKDYVDRELLIAYENRQNIENAIHSGKVLKLTLRKDCREEYLKAYCIRQDSENLYNYVAGYVSPNGRSPWVRKVMRLSYIEKAEVRSGSGFLSKVDKGILESEIKAKGVQFISETGAYSPIIVEFTKDGEQLYERIRHLRPQYVRKIGPLTYEFACSRIQARFYFFKFGGDAKILAPDDLAAEFRREYERAVKLYEE